MKTIIWTATDSKKKPILMAPITTVMGPIVEIDSTEVELHTRLSGGPGVARIDVKGPKGKIARFWVDVVIRRGRPILNVTTKPSPNRRIQTTKKLQGCFNIEENDDTNNAPASSIGG